MSTTLGTLYDLPAPEPVFEKLKEIIASSLPPDWRNWTVLTTMMQGTINEGHKARFAIPSVQLFSVLAPGLTQISERKYRSIKVALLAWPLGRALIYAPSSLSVKIRGSQEVHDHFIRQVEILRPTLLSRKELNENLCPSPGSQNQFVPSTNSEHNDLSDSENEPSPSFEPLSPVKQPESAENLRVASLEARMASLQSTVASLVEAIQSSVQPSQIPDTLSVQQDDSDGDEGSTAESSDEEALDLWGRGSFTSPTDNVKSSFFDPLTAEKDPDILDPLPELSAQAIQCQRLGKPGWNRVRYLEAERRLKRSGVFQPLEMNPHFSNVAPASDYALWKQERLLASVTHGLLAQRKAFRKGCESLTTLCPGAAPFIDQCFLQENTDFRAESDALLQFTCGKRAEVLAARRKAVEPNDAQSRRRLRLIPPSTTHLFDDEALGKWVASSGSVLPKPVFRAPYPSYNRKRPPMESFMPPLKRQKLVSNKEGGGGRRSDQYRGTNSRQPKVNGKYSSQNQSSSRKLAGQSSSYKSAGTSHQEGSKYKRRF
ncbi:hypothetical protein GE061_016821 [Apolygus lucorum]|uniref:Uncharacterized protein n=1 Tax=Apolygus lucorum TaxID=248454 RepID=A0A6A4JVF9_APOLU|nr:hypothetical protein GE061_016821 [Apolygus lucorum]